jgi:ferredoxin/flavodoxin---NADP+ reductase
VTREKFIPAKIADRIDLAKDLFTLIVETEQPLPYVSGQYATLALEVDGKTVERPYSMCSSPYESRLEFFLERVPNGALTPLLYDLQKGASLFLRRFAKGRFTLDLRSGRTNHLLLATVAGIAPYISYIRTLYQDWKKGDGPMPGDHRLFCLHGASHSAEFGYKTELERIAEEVPWLKYIPTVSRPWEEQDWAGEKGRADDLIRKYLEIWNLKPRETTGYLCGHPGMVETARNILFRAGWAKDAVQEEAYFNL